MSQCDRILALLADGKPHDHHALYALGCVAHSRVAELRKRGYRIDQWREGDLYLYRLVGALGEGDASVRSGTVAAATATDDSACGADSSASLSPSEPVQLELVPDEPEQRGAYWQAA